MKRHLVALGMSFSLLGGSAFAAERTVILAVENMTCATCGPVVKGSLKRVSGVRDVTVSLKEQTATVTFDDAATAVPALVAATTNAGYPSRPKAQ